MSADRLAFKPPQFVDSGPTYREVYGDSSQRSDLIHKLRRRQALAENQNAAWLEEELKKERQARKDPMIDVLAVTECGDVINSYSTYTALKYNSQFALTEGDMVDASRERKKFVYFLTGQRETILIWHRPNDAKITESLQSGLGKVEVEEYPVKGECSDISVAHVKGGVMGSGKLSAKGIIYGRLGFWANTRLGMGEHGAHVNIQRVRFEATHLLPRDAYVSPLDREEVIRRDGQPMDSKYGGVDVVRIDPAETGGDFIVGAIRATSQFPCPVVLGYSPHRPWKGEVPKHG